MSFINRLLGKQEQPQPTQAPVRKKVLIAEADEALKASYIQMFQNEFDVISVGNGADGLNNLLSFPANLIIIDLEMPVMDGKVMLHSLRALPAFKTTPVIVISSSGDSETIKQIKFYDNANAFILKTNATAQEVYNTSKTLIV